MQNHSTWAANTIIQDFIVLLVMIRDLTPNMKETKQGTGLNDSLSFFVF